ncbi:hypothetical protein ILUMI_19043, partial [Ignelater luminosus]
PTWKRHRKIIMPTFNQNILNGFVKVFAQQAENLVEQLQKIASKGEVNIHSYIFNCTVDTFCETSMGIAISAQTTDCTYPKLISRILEIAGSFVSIHCCLNDFVLKCIPTGRELIKLINKVHNFTATAIKQRLDNLKDVAENKEKQQSFCNEDVNKRKTFLDQLIELSGKSGTNFTETELRDEVDTFMFAGSDTTATTISFALIMLAMFPEIQDEVYREILDVLGPDKSVEWTDLGKFMYLERVLKETMRLFPVSAGISRSVSEDIKLYDYILPAGSTVSIQSLQLHRDPEIWPDPLKFDPDRFLPQEITGRHPYSYIPFSAGPRNCVGHKYAMMAMKTLVAIVVRKCRLSTSYRNVEDVKLQFDILLKPVHGYKISVELRNTVQTK